MKKFVMLRVAALSVLSLSAALAHAVGKPTANEAMPMQSGSSSPQMMMPMIVAMMGQTFACPAVMSMDHCLAMMKDVTPGLAQSPAG